MIVNGNNNTISNYNNLPQMSETIKSWFLPMSFATVSYTKRGVDWIETLTTVDTEGVKQELRGKDLEIYPEGERAWNWIEIHCLPNLDLNVNEYVYYDNVKYKVRKTKKYKEYGFCIYHLQEAYEDMTNEGI